MKKKLLAVLLVAVMAVSMITGCASAPPAATTTAAVTTASAATEQVAATPRPVKEFTVFSLNDLPWNKEGNMDDPVGQALTAATGVKLKGEKPIGDWKEALALMISSGDLPDMIINTSDSMTQLVDAKVLRPLKDKIMKSPNLVSLFGDEIGHLAYSSKDPEFYSFGTGPRPSEYYAFEFAEFAFWIQIDAIKKAGYPKIRTIQEYEDVLAAYVKANPKIDGQPTIGFTLSAQEWRWLFSLIGGINNSAGFASDGKWYVDPKTNEITALVRRPEAKQYIAWLNHMYNIGLMDKETFTQTYDQAKAKVANGRVIGFANAWWIFYDSIYALAQKSPERDYFPFPARFDPDNTQWRDSQSHGTLEGNGYSITTAVSEEDTQLLVNFFDYFASDAGQKLIRWGVEGQSYTFDQNDTSREWVARKDLYQGTTPSQRRVDPLAWSIRNATTDLADIRKKTGIEKYTEMLGTRDVAQDGTVINDYKRDDNEYFSKRAPVLQEALTAYGIKGQNGIMPHGYPVALDLPKLMYGPIWSLATGSTSEATKVANTQYEEAIPRDLAKCITAKPTSFDTEWDNFMKSLDTKMNLKVLEDEMTMLLKQRMEMWYGKK